MASRTQETKFKRELRRKKGGKDTKRARRRGTTPSFPIHTEAADKNAPNEAKPKND
jgi:hypothetical protein|tara:strand:- start:67 stop:234 length:168 start_codon:yes stop_codon:yes gene_type:complete